MPWMRWISTYGLSDEKKVVADSIVRSTTRNRIFEKCPSLFSNDGRLILLQKRGNVCAVHFIQRDKQQPFCYYSCVADH